MTSTIEPRYERLVGRLTSAAVSKIPLSFELLGGASVTVIRVIEVATDMVTVLDGRQRTHAVPFNRIVRVLRPGRRQFWPVRDGEDTAP
jgi:hypothetical protein